MSDYDDDCDELDEEDQEILDLFVVESSEALERVEQTLLAAERGEASQDFLNVLFRDVHTIKGTSGFFNFKTLLEVAHAAEDLLGKLRSEEREASAEHLSCLMEVVDVLRDQLDAIRDQGKERQTDYEPLVRTLRAFLSEEGPAEDDEKTVVLPATPKAAPEPEPAAQRAAPPPPPPEPLVQAPPPASQEKTKTEPEKSARSAPQEGSSSSSRASSAEGTVRVNVRLLDNLMNLMGELVLARNQIVQMVKTTQDASVTAQAACQRLSLVTTDIQEEIMKTRMQPVARVFERIPRIVRDLSRATGKRVEAQIDGRSTEIDKALVEVIRDPVVHIVRNAIDHAIETPKEREAIGKSPVGQLTVRAAHEGGQVCIEVRDDGRGIDPEKMRGHAVTKGLISRAEADRLSDRDAVDLIFRPGFSTAKVVTDLSGRGVGMDVVRSRLESAGGQVELDSRLGQGTTIRLRMPLTLAIVPALLVSACGQRFAIPQVNLLELVYVDPDQAQTAIEQVRGASIYRLRGEVLPVVWLGDVLGLERDRSLEEGVHIVVVSVGSRRYGLAVDQIHDTEEIVIKPLHGDLQRIPCYAGATVLGDGGVVLIIDVAGAAEMVGIDAKTEAARGEQDEGEVEDAEQYMLCVAAGQQCAVPLSMVARLEHIETGAIETVAGEQVIQYRGGIMPILRPSDLLPLERSATEPDEVELVVFDFGQPVAMAVSEILDVTEVRVDAKSGFNAMPYTLGKAVVRGRTTIILDVYAMVRELVPQFLRRRQESARRAVLLVEDSPAMRGAITTYLRAAGIVVKPAESQIEALRAIRSSRAGGFDAVIAGIGFDDGTWEPWLRQVSADRPDLPVVAWAHFFDDDTLERVRVAGASAVDKLDREGLARALAVKGIALRDGRTKVGV